MDDQEQCNIPEKTIDAVKRWRRKKDEEHLEECLDTILNRFDLYLPTDCALGQYEPIFRKIMKEEFCKLTGKIKTTEW